MAVQPWELVEREQHPQLRLVTAPAPPGGKPLLASLFVVFIALVVGIPSIATAVQPRAEAQRWVPRPRPAAEISSLDPLGEIPKSGRPESRDPFAGMLFVRCTRLWAAAPDGSHARKVLEIPGISSPAIAPNARTVAFFVATDTGQELWMAGADGSDPTRVGPLTEEGSDVLARATSLSWAPNGERLAFALVDGRYGEFEGGAAIWTLRLSDGRFTREGTGWPAPFWIKGKVFFARISEQEWPTLTSPEARNDWIASRTRTSKHDLTASLAPLGYSYNVDHGSAVLRDKKEVKQLVVKGIYRRRIEVIAEAPRGYGFARHARPALAQDGSSVAIEVVDRAGERDLGILDVSTERWAVLDYAWDPAASPAPVARGPIGAERATSVVGDLMINWNRGGLQRNLLVEERDRAIFNTEERWGLEYIARPATRVEGGWAVPVTAVMARGRHQVWRSASLVVGSEDGRVTVDIRDATEATEIREFADVMPFVESALGRAVSVPPVPVDANVGWVYAWNYNGGAQTGFDVEVPVETSNGLKTKTLGFGFGEDLDFSLGCGGEVSPYAVDLGGVPAVADSSAGTNQVIWPATMERRQGTYSVHGYQVPKEKVIDIARTMASSTP